MLDSNASLKFVVAALATWRVTHLIAYEDGPWNVIAQVRARAGSGFWAKLMDCFYCLSFWVAAVAAVAIQPRIGEWPLVWLGLAGAACLMERIGTDRVIIRQLREEETHEQPKGETEDVLLRPEPGESGGENQYAGTNYTEPSCIDSGRQFS